MITLAVDAMGGDQGLAVTVPGATAFLQAHPDVRLIMTGDETQLRQALTAAAHRWNASTSAIPPKLSAWMNPLSPP
ncbi:hypothetical protein BWZ27_02180 [Neisseria meningitidis]|nr:hypothetical protein BWZ30_02805 [Neisseria meningitidis]OMH47350.1 hypothetical protein BWZ27_02180 [Neisseria meningitidis]